MAWEPKVEPIERGGTLSVQAWNQMRDASRRLNRATPGLRGNQSSTGLHVARKPEETEILIWINAWALWGATGKRWKYGWEEVRFTDAGVVSAVSGGQSGTVSSDYVINLKELNNTSGADTAQGNSMELVAPLGGGTGGTPAHKVICMMKTVVSSDGTVQRVVDEYNSDHIEEGSTITIGSASADGGSEAAETTSQNFEDDQSGAAAAGERLDWNVMHRVGYFESPGDETLWGYIRTLTYRPNGKLRLIGGEGRYIVDTPADCP